MEALRRYCNNFFHCKLCLFLEDVDFICLRNARHHKGVLHGADILPGAFPFFSFLTPEGVQKKRLQSIATS